MFAINTQATQSGFDLIWIQCIFKINYIQDLDLHAFSLTSILNYKIGLKLISVALRSGS